MPDNNSNGNDQKQSSRTPIRASSLFGSVRSLERQLKKMRSVTQPLGGLQDFVAKPPKLRTDSLAWLQDLDRQMAVPTEQLSWLNSVKSVGTELERWCSFHEQIQKIAEHQQRMREMCRVPAGVLAQDLNAISDAVNRLSLNTTYPNLSERLLAPTTYYSRFSRGILAELQELPEGHRARALSGSLLIAEDQLSATTELMIDLLREPIGPDIVTEVPEYTLFERIRDDLLDAEELPAVDDSEALYEVTQSNGVAMEVRTILQATENCNRNAEMKGDGEVFRPTSAMFGTAADLCFFAPARRQNELGPVLDALYKLLYEGAGADQKNAPRYMRRGYMSDDECAVVWRIKHFRNYWYRHDYGHGSTSEQRRKMRQLHEDLQAYGLDGMPSAPAEYEQLHRGLIEDVSSFMQLLERRIRE